MSFSAVFLLAAALAAPPAPAADEGGRGQGAQVASAEVSAKIVRPAVLRGGKLASSDSAEAPHSQVLRRDGRVTYEFE